MGFRFPIEERPFCSIFQNYFCWFLVTSKEDLFILLLKPIFYGHLFKSSVSERMEFGPNTRSSGQM